MVRQNLLDRPIIISDRDLRRLSKEQLEYLHQKPPYQSLDQESLCKIYGNLDFGRLKIRRQRFVEGLPS